MIEPAQDARQLILDSSGHVLVRGSAGSGKTTIALRKAVQRIEEGLCEGQSVLFLSFSRSAVFRIAQASKTEAPSQKRRFLALQTFHSFCWELLRTHGYLLGAPTILKILLPQDERALSNGAARDSKEWPKWETERRRLFHEEGKLVFDLFAPMAADLLHRSVLIRNLVTQRFPLVIVDEAQDTGPDAWRCIEILASTIPIVCLADLDQQIFDHLPGIGPERIAAIEKALNPLCVDLGGENNRCLGTDIAAFANDVLSCKVRGAPYKGVTRFGYRPQGVDFQKLIRQGLAIILKKIEDQTGNRPDSCAILAPYGAGVARITAALSAGDKPIPHKVLFDEAEVLLATRLAAFLLEPKTDASHTSDVALSLELLAATKRASGAKTGIQKGKQLLLWANQLRQGKCPRGKLVAAAQRLVVSAKGMQLSGNPAADWLLVKNILKGNPDSSIAAIAGNLDYLVAFRRGKRISANLSEMWSDRGCYSEAREAVDAALAEDQILSGIEDLTGIHVMTIHRSKGKQFDGVIILREAQRGANGWSSSLIWRGDQHPYPRSRKILRVAITRAMKHVLILDPFFPKCPILSDHKL
jgi:DNA helicase-2/ATP-dependent DNA helicase PcrA